MSMATGIPNLIPTVDKHNIVEIITNGKKKMDNNYFFATLRTLRSSEGCSHDVLQRWRVHEERIKDRDMARQNPLTKTWHAGAFKAITQASVLVISVHDQFQQQRGKKCLSASFSSSSQAAL